MKRKILAVGLLSLSCLALFTGESQAFFGLLSPYHPSSLWNRHNRYVTHITVRPYNAFTPICWGNLVCDGVCPSPCGVASGCMPMTMGVPQFPCSGGACVGMPYFGNGYAQNTATVSDMPMTPPVYNAPAPQQFVPPSPNPIGPTTMMYPPRGVSQASYPMYAPQYYPTYYMPQYNPYYMGWTAPQPMPYYWQGYGR
ncbi:MAG: hypothetical protein HYX68_20255 [Planctomycetes bacterium]|nr:hypothetical protein [Planctomycetota bacterium]